MAETDGYTDPGSFDAATVAAAYERIIHTGYQVGYLNELATTQNTPTAMNVLVATGGAWVKGLWHSNNTVKTMTIEAAHATYHRYDLIVVRRTGTTSVGLAVLKGIASATPSPPTLTTDVDTVYEIAIARIYIAATTAAITTAMITNLRLSVYCGPSLCEAGFIEQDTSGNITLNGKNLDTEGGSINLGGAKINEVADPSADQDADTQAARNAAIATLGFTWQPPVVCATIANGTLSSAFANGETVDGVTLVTGDRILIKAQTAGAANGIYTVNATGAPTRATNFNTSAKILNASIPVSEGSINRGQAFRVTNTSAITVDATVITFATVGGWVAPSASNVLRYSDDTERTMTITVAYTYYYPLAYIPIPSHYTKGAVRVKFAAKVESGGTGIVILTWGTGAPPVWDITPSQQLTTQVTDGNYTTYTKDVSIPSGGNSIILWHSGQPQAGTAYIKEVRCYCDETPSTPSW